MTYSIELPPALAKRVRQEARKRKLDVQEFLRQAVEGAVATATIPRTGAELVEYWRRLGLIGMWADRADIGDSAKYARALRQQAEQRRPSDFRA